MELDKDHPSDERRSLRKMIECDIPQHAGLPGLEDVKIRTSYQSTADVQPALLRQECSHTRQCGVSEASVRAPAGTIAMCN